MTKPANPQSQKRFSESMAQLFMPKTGQDPVVFLKSSSDQGVIRNFGRNGARFAPQSLLATFKKLAQDHHVRNHFFTEYEVASQEQEEKDFNQAQSLEAKEISTLFSQYSSSTFIHIGGGHDHAYPFLKALSEKYQKIIVINIDAHADTRTDQEFHSGTPFRQFADDFSGEFHLFQIGLHEFANSLSTLSPLKKGEQSVLWRNELHVPGKRSAFFEKIQKTVDDESAVFFSVDADALKASEVPGVSAVNSNGIALAELQDLWKFYAHLPLKHAPLLGIYELNPLYDTISSISMRTMATFIFGIL